MGRSVGAGCVCGGPRYPARWLSAGEIAKPGVLYGRFHGGRTGELDRSELGRESSDGRVGEAAGSVYP